VSESPSLEVLTPTIYRRLWPFERRLANRYFSSWLRRLESQYPGAGDDNVRLAARRAYGYAIYFYLRPAALLGVAGASLLSFADNHLVLRVGGTALLVAMAMLLTTAIWRAARFERLVSALGF